MTADRELVRKKLASLADHLARVEARRPASLTELAADRDIQNILARNLGKAIQRAIDIATHFGAAHGRAVQTSSEAFEALADLGLIEPGIAKKLVQAVGCRNVLVHEYADIDWAIVLDVCTTGVEDLKAFGRIATGLAT